MATTFDTLEELRCEFNRFQLANQGWVAGYFYKKVAAQEVQALVNDSFAHVWKLVWNRFNSGKSIVLRKALLLRTEGGSKGKWVGGGMFYALMDHRRNQNKYRRIVSPYHVLGEERASNVHVVQGVEQMASPAASPLLAESRGVIQDFAEKYPLLFDSACGLTSRESIECRDLRKRDGTPKTANHVNQERNRETKRLQKELAYTNKGCYRWRERRGELVDERNQLLRNREYGRRLASIKGELAEGEYTYANAPCEAANLLQLIDGERPRFESVSYRPNNTAS